MYLINSVAGLSLLKLSPRQPHKGGEPIGHVHQPMPRHALNTRTGTQQKEYHKLWACTQT
jgi:hypothetical protein